MAAAKRDDIYLQVFDGEEYAKWRFKLKLFLELKNCEEVLDAEDRPSEITEKQWKEKELKAKNYIVNSVTNTQLELIIAEPTAKKMVEKLDHTYLVKSSTIKLLKKRRLLDLKFREGDDPLVFFNQFEKCVNELKNAGEVITEEEKVNYLQLALPESLSRMVDLIDALPEKDRTVEFVKSKLIVEFQKRETANTDRRNETQAFNSSGPRSFRGGRGVSRGLSRGYNTRGNSNGQRQQVNHDKTMNSQRRDMPPIRCFKCNGIGHIQRLCRINYKMGNNYQRSYQHTQSLPRVTGNNAEEDTTAKNSFNIEVMTTSTDTSRESDNAELVTWLLDSGCSDHIINSDKYFYKSEKLKDPVDIKVGDGFSLKAEKIGNINMKFNVNGKWVETEIKNIFYVPNMRKNLLSVSSIVKQGNLVVFNNDNADVFNGRNQLIAVAYRKGKLFELEGMLADVDVERVNTYSSSIKMTNKEKWHRILGHTNFKDLKHICESQLLNGVPKEVEDFFLKCEICLTSKMTNLKFKNERSRANDLLEIVHTDVNGPITQTGINGEKYFVSFIDDFSKLAIVYCIEKKVMLLIVLLIT